MIKTVLRMYMMMVLTVLISTSLILRWSTVKSLFTCSSKNFHFNFNKNIFPRHCLLETYHTTDHWTFWSIFSFNFVLQLTFYFLDLSWTGPGWVGQSQRWKLSLTFLGIGRKSNKVMISNQWKLYKTILTNSNILFLLHQSTINKNL